MNIICCTCFCDGYVMNFSRSAHDMWYCACSFFINWQRAYNMYIRRCNNQAEFYYFSDLCLSVWYFVRQLISTFIHFCFATHFFQFSFFLNLPLNAPVPKLFSMFAEKFRIDSADSLNYFLFLFYEKKNE